MKNETENKPCAFAKCDLVSYKGKRFCKSHLETQRSKMAEYRAERKKRGLCSRCSNPARLLPNGSASTLCNKCRYHVRELERTARQKKNEA